MSEGERESREDAAWREIIDHYGDRPELSPDEHDSPGEPDRGPEIRPIARPAHDQDRWNPDEHYVPPAPPPAPRPTGPRGLAWVALFGAPAVLLISMVVGFALPGWAGFLLFLAFVGSFGYLVATMRRDDDDGPYGPDDGAVV